MKYNPRSLSPVPKKLGFKYKKEKKDLRERQEDSKRWVKEQGEKLL
jgi:transposase